MATNQLNEATKYADTIPSIRWVPVCSFEIANRPGQTITYMITTAPIEKDTWAPNNPNTNPMNDLSSDTGWHSTGRKQFPAKVLMRGDAVLTSQISAIAQVGEGGRYVAHPVGGRDAELTDFAQFSDELPWVRTALRKEVDKVVFASKRWGEKPSWGERHQIAHVIGQ